MSDKIAKLVLMRFELTKKVVDKEIQDEIYKLGFKRRKQNDERYVKFWLNKHKIFLTTDEDDGYIVYTLIKGRRIIRRWKLETIETALKRTGGELIERHNG